MQVSEATVPAVNGLTARWADRAGDSDRGTVFSAAGVWPLLAFLADGAGGAARTELAGAVGLPADQAAVHARELLGALDGLRGAESALGLWTKRTLALRERWAAGLPAGTHGVLSGDPAADREALDTWAHQRTGGLIDAMPVPVTEETQLVLAGALTVRTEWLRRFHEGLLEPGTGPWRGRSLRGLYRSSTLLDRVGVADTPEGHVTELRVLGNTAVDVHLLLGEEHMTPDQVLRAGIGVLGRRHSVVPGPRLPFGDAGPGLRVRRVRSTRPEPPTLHVRTVAYDLSAHHDLLALHRLFGLTTARDDSFGHFPGISDFPLAVGSAAQAAVATFGPLGFRAGAVSAFGAVAGCAIPEPRYLTTSVDTSFDRPFGFLALHRHTRLVLAAGWVTDPEPYPEDPWEDDTHDG
ncbi:serpin family protein [Streptomyces sp. NPDC006393]|uniref:serpin family protein n=1 Tax=Streptomyces sp. NPDC006393 TaxID=3156763 RepID=UPI0034067D61